MMIISSLICPTAIQSEIIFTTPQKYFKFFVASIFEILESPREKSNFDTDHKCTDMIEYRSESWPEILIQNLFGPNVGPKINARSLYFPTGPYFFVSGFFGPDQMLWRRSLVKSVLIWIWVGFGLGPYSRIPFWF